MMRINMDYKYIVSGHSKIRDEIVMYYLKDDNELDMFIEKVISSKKEDIDYMKSKLRNNHSASISVKEHQFTFTEVEYIEPYYK